MHVTLQDVARHAGVSSKTVSRVVNNQGEVSEATRQRVRAAIEQLGYRPNYLARSLVHHYTNTLAVVASDLEFYGPSRILTGIEYQTYELGYALFFNLLPHSRQASIISLLDSLAIRQVDGILWAVPEFGDNHAWITPEILQNLPPIVFLSMAPVDGLSWVAVDNRTGAAEIARHLIEIGRRQIAIITGPMDWWESRERFAGFKNALEEAGLGLDPRLVVAGDWTTAGGQTGMQQLLAQNVPVDAVFAANDQMALGALGAAHQLNRKIPEDIAVAGFDNIPEAAYYWPPLTTVRQPLYQAGCTAVEILHALIKAQQGQGSHPPQVPLLNTELIIRESTIGPLDRSDA
jgi:LacI family transcriptional regulator